MQPVIKWTGSKRYLAKEIISYFPKEIDTYYEPFLGSGAVFYELVYSDIKAKRYVLSDINQTLIEYFQLVKDDPYKLIDHYKVLHDEFMAIDDFNERKEYYYEKRRIFNQSHSAIDFIFINRSAQNGLIRYNKKGEFNTGCNAHRIINADNLANIILDWNLLLNNIDVEFKVQDYRNILPKEGDFVFYDPPYEKVKGPYYNSFDADYFIQWLNASSVWALTYDGKVEVNGVIEDFSLIDVDYDKHIFLRGIKSNFGKLHRKTIGERIVYESLYLKGV